MTKAKCAECQKLRYVAKAHRFGGGTGRRAGRYYWGSICAECATRILRTQQGESSQTVTLSRWTAWSLRGALRTLNAVPCEAGERHGWIHWDGSRHKAMCRWCGVKK